jgi:pimeloyl-ACP methyl ester carboxylesterase
MPHGTVSSTDPEITIAYEVRGDADGTPLLMIHGLGAQLVTWHPDLLQMLVDRGYQLAVFDNRDAGLSTHFTELGEPDVEQLLARDASSAGYGLSDLADDAAGVLDLVGWESAHILGVSMGGMVAQMLAIRHPRRVRSLTSIMSTTGAQEVGQPTDAALATLLAPPPVTVEDAINNDLNFYQVVGSTGFPLELDYVRARAALAWERDQDPHSTTRQAAAVVAADDRTDALAGLRIPTLVVHGDADPLIDVSGGRATAAAIPGAEYLEVEGMGHDLPRQVWPRLIDRLDDVVMRGENHHQAA